MTENGFSLKQVKFRLDRQHYWYWKETKWGECLWLQALSGPRQGDTQGMGWSDAMTLEDPDSFWPPLPHALRPVAHRRDGEE